MSAKVNFLNNINRVAETAFLIKPILESSLKKRLNGHFLVGFFSSFPHNREVYPLYFIFMIKICKKCKAKSSHNPHQRWGLVQEDPIRVLSRGRIRSSDRVGFRPRVCLLFPGV